MVVRRWIRIYQRCLTPRLSLLDHNQEGQRVSKLIERMAKAIDVVISGFDRIVFKGFLRPLMFPDGAMSFLARNNVLNKDW